MRIIAIDIYGFGKFQQYQQDFDQGLQVCYGENEAGKSTIYAFIHAVLFGFPTKSVGASNYEPKQGANYGGSVTIALADEQYKVERVKKRSGNEIRVYYPDGSIGEESDLKTILQGIDRGFFEQIFSFNLDGLQDVFKLNENEIGRFLFYTGVSGSDRLWDTEKQLDKEIEALYKPQGRIPRLNVDIDQLKDSAQALKIAKQSEAEHERFTSEQASSRHRSEEIDTKLAAAERKLVQYQEQNRLMPLALERETASQRLEEIGEMSFPANGLERMRTCLAKLEPQEEILLQKEQKLQLEREAVAGITIDENILAAAFEIEQCKTSLVKIETLIEQNKELSTAFDHKREEITACQDHLHLRLSDTQITALDTSMFTKKKISELETARTTLLGKSEELERKYTIGKEQLSLLEVEITQLESQQMSPAEITAIEAQLQSGDQSALLAEVEETIARLSSKATQPDGKHKIAFFLGAAGVAGLSLILLLVGEGNLFFSAIFFVLALIIAGIPFLLGRSSSHRSALTTELAHYEQKKRQLVAGAISLESRQTLETSRRENNQVSEDLRLKRARHADCLEDLRQTELTLGQVDHELTLVQTEQLQQGKNLYLSDEVTESSLMVAFEQLEQLKNLVNEQFRIEKQQIAKQGDMHKLLDYIKQVARKVGIETTDDYHSVVQRLATTIETAKQMQLEQKNHLQRIAELEAELEPILVLIISLQKEKEQLLQVADCPDCESFYVKGRLDAEVVEVQEKLRLLNVQIEHFDFIDINESALRLEIDRLGQQCDMLKIERGTTLEQLAQLKQDIRQIETAGKVETRAQMHQKNIETFRADAAEWMKLVIAKGILQKATRTFKEEKLPAIVAKAQQYLLFLTEDEYEKIIFDQENGLQLLDRFGNLVPAKDLSRGTAEMLYTALRFSFTHSLQGRMKYPIIIDDSFVNFDKNRTVRIIELLHEISKEQQILFFTCHEHLLSHFDQSSVTTLGEFQLSFFG